MQTAENVWATNGRLPFAAARVEVEAAVSTGLTAIGLAQNQKESVASNPVRSYLAQLKDDVGRKSLKTTLGLGIDVVLGFVRDALKEVPGTHCTIALDSSPRNYSRTGAPAHVTAFVVHCPFVKPEVAEFFPAVFKCVVAICMAASSHGWRVRRLEAHAKSHSAPELLDLLLRAIDELGVKREQVLSLMTDNASV